MVLPVPPLNPSQPIPNYPFFYPKQDSLVTGSGAPLIVGSGICINYATSVITAISGCGIPCNLIIEKGDLIGGAGPSLPQRVALGDNGQVLTVNTACPQGLQWTFACGIPPSVITGKGALIVGTDVATASALPVGTNACLLTVDSSTTTGLAWKTNTAIPCGLLNKGIIITGSDACIPYALPPGASGQYLTACSTTSSGLRWTTLPSFIPTCCYTGKGYILAGCAAGCSIPLVPGAAGQLLRTNPATATGLEWFTCNAIPSACVSGCIGGLIVGCSTTFGTLCAGDNNQFLAVDLSSALGLKWCTPSYLSCNFLTQKGQIIAAADGGVPTALPPGTRGQILIVDDREPVGLKWANCVSICTTCGIRSCGPIGSGVSCAINMTDTPATGIIGGVYNFQVWGQYCQTGLCTSAACGYFRMELYDCSGNFYAGSPYFQYFATGRSTGPVNYGIVPISMNWIFDTPEYSCLFLRANVCSGSAPICVDVYSVSSLFDNFYK